MAWTGTAASRMNTTSRYRRFSPAGRHISRCASCRARNTVHERVLRYPNGTVRTIRYPAPEPTDSYVPGRDGPPCSIEHMNAGVPEHFILDEALCDVSGDIFEHWISDMELQRSRFMDPQAPPAEAAPLPNTRDNMAAMPATPAEFLRMVQSDALIRSQKEEWARVHGCYEVLEGCPFVPSRPLLTIALPSNSRDSEYGPAYALRTRRPMDTEESALARLLDLTTENGEAKIKVSRMVDGVVAFEGEAEARAFSALLQEEGEQGPEVVPVDAFELFRLCREASSVVVLLRDGCFVPQPYQLAVSLKGERPEERGGGGAN